MEQIHWTLHDAKNRFSALVNDAQHGQPQLVTKHGTPAVVVISVKAYQDYLSISRRQQPSFGDYLLAIPQSDTEIERMDPQLRDLDL